MTIFEIVFLSLALLVVVVCGIKIRGCCRKIDKILDELERELDYMEREI